MSPYLLPEGNVQIAFSGGRTSAYMLEALTGHTFSKRYSHASLREMVERMGPGLFSDEAYLCQANDGECVG